MKIKTITCHDVYNVGASLQAYALQIYLTQAGHDVEIINYRPDYLRHYRLWWVPNARFDKPVIRTIYNLAKLPGRLKSKLTDPRKKEFDTFTKTYLKITEREYSSNEELCQFPPEADIYIAGSDQIWNPLFRNGKDPAFFLDFAPDSAVKISYAASFSVDRIPEEEVFIMQNRLRKLDEISVRERSGLAILSQMGLQGFQVCDPVFLISRDNWNRMKRKNCMMDSYMLVYDFDNNSSIAEFALEYAKKNNLKLVSVYPLEGAHCVLDSLDPLSFITIIEGTSYVVSNSFHATAFSLIFHKEFVVFNRKESINTRMQDLLTDMGLTDRLITEPRNAESVKPIDWKKIDQVISSQRSYAERFLKQAIDARRS